MGIYLDSHTASRPFPSSIERMHALFKVTWGSLSAPHQIGQDALSVANTSLQIIYDFLGARVKKIFLHLHQVAVKRSLRFFCLRIQIM